MLSIHKGPSSLNTPLLRQFLREWWNVGKKSLRFYIELRLFELRRRMRNKVGYTALGAPKHVDKRRRYGPTDGWTDRPSYRGASEHL